MGGGGGGGSAGGSVQKTEHSASSPGVRRKGKVGGHILDKPQCPISFLLPTPTTHIGGLELKWQQAMPGRSPEHRDTPGLQQEDLAQTLLPTYQLRALKAIP